MVLCNVFLHGRSLLHITNKQDMARAIEKRNSEMYHRVKFQSIRGRLVDKSIWSPYARETLMAYPDDQLEVLEYDKFAVGIYEIYKKKKIWKNRKNWLAMFQ